MRGWRGKAFRSATSRSFALQFIGAISLSLNVYAGGSAVVKKAAVVTASPLATKAGVAVLRSGGTAADAAVAVALVLSVVHPQAGNLGGGGFALYYDAETGAIWALDFRETAPLAATREMYTSVPEAARRGALTAGVPGAVAGLEALHQKFGRQSWKALVEPALNLAREGVPAGADLIADIKAASDERDVLVFPDAEAGKPLAMPDFAATLQRLGEAGPRDFYTGSLARKLVKGVRDAGGMIGFRDLRDYTAVWRAPIKMHYGAYEIYTAPPPSAAGIVIGETLNILSGDDLAKSGFQTPGSLHVVLEAQRRAFIDAHRYVADPASSRIPYHELLSVKRASLWRRTIQSGRAIGTSELVDSLEVSETEHTTHFTIADKDGNIVALTTSLGDDFGSGVTVPGLGFLLNSAMRDFTTGANVVDAGKRPATSISPVLVLHDGRPFLALGTEGGGASPTTIMQVFLGLTVYGMTLSEAVAAPRYHHQAVPDHITYERGRAPQATIDALNVMGHAVVPRAAIGDVHAILFHRDHMIAVADPRHSGAAGGY